METMIRLELQLIKISLIKELALPLKKPKVVAIFQKQ